MRLRSTCKQLSLACKLNTALTAGIEFELWRTLWDWLSIRPSNTDNTLPSHSTMCSRLELSVVIAARLHTQDCLWQLEAQREVLCVRADIECSQWLHVWIASLHRRVSTS
jgi:hypothetical protein